MYPVEALETPADCVVLDTCVVGDLLFHERPRHESAVKLAAVLGETKRTALIPAHAYFELVCLAGSERRRANNTPLTAVGKRSALLPFEHTVVAIDLNFVQHYLLDLAASAPALFEVRGGADMIFAAIALRHGAVLISEDAALLRTALASGVDAVDIQTYLDRQT